jgi:hypothetical protein
MNGVPDARAIRTIASRTIEAGFELWQVGVERRAAWLAQAFARLREPEHPLGKLARAQIPTSAGLSPEMVSWALESALAPLTTQALRAYAGSVPKPHPRARPVRPGQLCVLILAGNVFTAAARGVGLPLLFGWPVLAKASSHDDAFPHLLERALKEVDPVLGHAYRALTFAGDDGPRLSALFEQADAVSAYGSDGSLGEIRARLGATVSFVPHGHGLGAAFVGRAALAREDLAAEAARALALDVAAYDQRGCMSPLVCWAVRGGEVSLEAFAELLFAELARLRGRLPRGPLGLDVASSQLSWRGVGAMRGRLLEGDGYAVCLEERGALRLGPGHRNLQLIGLDDPSELPHKLAPLGVHLKCLGVAGVPDLEGLIASFPARVAPRVCKLGSMQTPPLESLQDGVPGWEGLTRWAEL